GTPQPKSSQEIRWVEREELEKYPFPKANKVLTERLSGKGLAELGI
ncbi:MAG TPA: A/G-specific adenine glycosylase, partial [Balneolaceae bacterium]|nr:A/G-specific adenine glycosylase [Balneolaceae bacterium]